MFSRRVQRPILVLTKSPPPFGGGEMRSAAMKRHLLGNPEFICFELHRGRRTKGNQELFAPWKVAEFIRLLAEYAVVLASHRPRLVFLHAPPFFMAFLRDSLLTLPAKVLGAAIVCDLPGERFFFLDDGPLQRAVGRLLLRQYDCLAVLGPSVARELASQGLIRTVVTDNGVEVTRTGPYVATPPDGPLRLLFVGTLSRQKGLDNLIQASIQLAQEGVAFELHCMGQWREDSFRREIEALLESAGLTNMVLFHGVLTGDAKWELMGRCQALVLPSLSEGQPLSVLEALGLGLPVIATTVGAVPHTIEAEVNGLLVPPGEVAPLTEAMRRLVTDERLRSGMSERNLELYERRFTLKSYLERRVAWMRSFIDGTADRSP